MLLRPYVTGRIAGALALGGAAAAAGAAALTIAAPPPMLTAYGRYMVTWLNQVEVIYTGEGINTSVAVSRFPDGVRNFHVAGKVEASSQPQDMRLQRMLGHLPALLHANPESVLVVGLGAGVTAGSFVQHPSVTRIVISEIEPLIPQVIAGYFRDENHDVVRDPRVEIVYDDARHFILTTRESFDVITSDPIHPWVKGSATLYTREYFELVKRRLKPGGIVTQWLPLYESEADAAQMVIATFFEAFPDGTIWANAQGPGAIDVVLMGRAAGGVVDVDRLHARLTSPPFAAAAASLAQVGFASAVDLLANYAGRASDLTHWLSGVEINRDRNLRLQYLAGLELNSYQSEQIYREILSRSTYPADLFVASPGQTAALKEALARAATARDRRPRS
jgi:spermidine synthase